MSFEKTKTNTNIVNILSNLQYQNETRSTVQRTKGRTTSIVKKSLEDLSQQQQIYILYDQSKLMWNTF